ncbi:MAG: DUF2520 domain-containing protein [Pyrinomonadaceae bacterium]|nr:DUF2520 domain-containing protein [Pyrinomonadaceae bacterium]
MSKKEKTNSSAAATLTAKPTVAIVGAGRLGTALARALVSRGYTITAMVARRLRSARAMVEIAGAHSAQALNSTKLNLLPPTDLIFITTPDDLIAPTAVRLSKIASNKRSVALHMSGALSSAELISLRKRGCAVGSLHPLIAVSDPVSGAENLRGAFFSVEGDRRAVNAARGIVRDLEGETFSINSANKALYHASAVVASGHTVALFDVAIELLARCGLSESEARRALLPLLRTTLENLLAEEPARALTGTFARADAATVRRHLAALKKQSIVGALELYALLGKRSLRLAALQGAAEKVLREVEVLLNGIEKPG